ncbi:MAG: hypothetical protein HZB80_03060 [Deltaproteobacteria bacterium]|nr:hypothetical protein [Deltaproteobacteria bacterium]
MNRVILVIGLLILMANSTFVYAETTDVKETGCEDRSGEIIEAVKKRTNELDIREEKLRIEEERFKTLKAGIDEKIGELAKARKELEKVIQDIKAEKQQGMENLVKIYESMPPEEAASRIEKLDEELAVKFLMTMKSKTAGRILAFVEPAKAAKLTQKLGGRLLPKEGL